MSRLSCRAALLVAVLAALWLALEQGSAKAAIPPGGTIGNASPSTSWQGQYYATASVTDPTLCPPGAADPGNVICDHFALTVQNAGTVTVTITWPSSTCASNPTNPTPSTPCNTDGNDFDLYVYDSGNMLVASSANPNPPGNSETVTFAATAQTYEVRVIPFFVVNSDYAGTASFQAPAGGGAGGGGGIDPPLSVSNASVTEGDAGTTAAAFTVTLGWAALVPVTVNYVTADAWAGGTATPGTDFVPVTGTVVIPPGQTQTSFSVPVVGDTAREGNETFLVNLYLPDPSLAVARIEDGQGVGTIWNDDWYNRVRGGGTVTTNVLTGAKGYFSFDVTEVKTGRISYRDSAVRFYSSQITAATWDDLTRTAVITGNGWNAGHSVTYRLETTDNGPGTLDTFVLTLSDGARGTGTITSGNITYYAG
jgi:hypothetical protein